jgi:hypothetical protein
MEPDLEEKSFVVELGKATLMSAAVVCGVCVGIYVGSVTVGYLSAARKKLKKVETTEK